MNKLTKKAAAKIFCAACLHCKVFRQTNDHGKSFIRLVRCAQGHWKDRHGGPLVLDYHTCYRRLMEECPDYNAACRKSEVEQYIRELKDNLPANRIIHTIYPGVNL